MFNYLLFITKETPSDIGSGAILHWQSLIKLNNLLRGIPKNLWGKKYNSEFNVPLGIRDSN